MKSLLVSFLLLSSSLGFAGPREGYRRQEDRREERHEIHRDFHRGPPPVVVVPHYHYGYYEHPHYYHPYREYRPYTVGEIVIINGLEFYIDTYGEYHRYYGR